MVHQNSLLVCVLSLLAVSSQVTPVPSDLWQPPQWVSSLSSAENCAYLESQPGDPVYQGKTTFSSSTNATFGVSDGYSSLNIAIQSLDVVNGIFRWPANLSQPEPGYYGNLTQYGYPYGPNQMSWTSYSCSCYNGNGTGWLSIDSISYTNGSISAINLRFQYQYNSTSLPLFGFLSWDSARIAYPPGPIPPPGGLWQPTSVPSSGNYVYLESQPGDQLGGGQNYTYLSSDAQLAFSFYGGYSPSYTSSLNLQINGVTTAYGTFQLMAGLTKLEKGYYSNVLPYNYALSTISWGGPAGWCPYSAIKPVGWFVIEKVSYSGTNLTSVQMKLEMRCSADAPALHGALNWAAVNPLNPPLPVYPPPSNLWHPPKSSIPASGNYMYVEGQAGAVVQGNLNFTYTTKESYFSLKWVPYLQSVILNITTDYWTQLQFQPLYTMSKLEKGYYEHIGPPYNNPARGRVGMTSVNCSYGTYSGWLSVDHIIHDGVDVTEMNVRFELECKNGNTVRVAIGWKASNRAGPKPVYPPPHNLWKPSAKVLPTTATYVYLEAEAGYLSSPAANYSYTPANSSISVQPYYNTIQVTIQGNEGWNGYFTACYGMKKLELGYYGDLGNNYAMGSLYWTSNNYSWCVTEGWFVLDVLKQEGEQASELQMRFQQHCQGQDPVIRGIVKWTADASLELA